MPTRSYQWLRSEKGGMVGNKIRWNFTKFLIDPEARRQSLGGSTTTPEQIADDIEALLPER